MAQQTAIIINQDGFVTETTYDDKNQLAALQGAVGGLIESVDWMGFGMDAYANEEGLYTEGLTVNLLVWKVLGHKVMGNVVIPRVTPTKRARLIKKGFSVREA